MKKGIDDVFEHNLIISRIFVVRNQLIRATAMGVSPLGIFSFGGVYLALLEVVPSSSRGNVNLYQQVVEGNPIVNRFVG